MIELNEQNGADKITFEYAKSAWSSFHAEEPVIGVQMGIAYGGGVEKIGQFWRDGKGIIYGYDTFIGHPRHLSDDPLSREADCMQSHYDKYGLSKLSYDYQRLELDNQGLDNVILVKGEITPQSCDNLEKIHYAFIDLDLIQSTITAYAAIRDKIVNHGFLLLHDVTEKNNLPLLFDWFYDQILYKDRKMWKIEGLWNRELLVCLKRMDL